MLFSAVVRHERRVWGTNVRGGHISPGFFPTFPGIALEFRRLRGRTGYTH